MQQTKGRGGQRSACNTSHSRALHSRTSHVTRHLPDVADPALLLRLTWARRELCFSSKRLQPGTHSTRSHALVVRALERAGACALLQRVSEGHVRGDGADAAGAGGAGGGEGEGGGADALGGGGHAMALVVEGGEGGGGGGSGCCFRGRLEVI